YYRDIYYLLVLVVLYFGILFFTVLFFIPDVLDIVAPLNKPRQHQLPLAIELIYDLEEHFLLFILNFLIISLIICTILLAVETLYMICIQHACGLLKLTSYRILNAFDDQLQLMSISKKSKCTICIKLSKAIKIHKRSLNINLFEFIKTIESKDTNQSLYFGLFITAHLGYMFWVNYFGQDLIDNSADVFAQTYNVKWYMVSTHVQKKILFILHRSSKNILFDVGNMFVFSLDGIATVIILL
ncbi:hypothetical protein ALC53_04728, partial [Atta colombica]